MFIFLDKKRQRISNWLKEKTTIDFSDWTIFILFLLGFCCLFFFDPDFEIKNYLEIIVLWFTAIVILLYTKETYYLKQISQKQLRQQVEPILFFYFEPLREKIFVTNLGNTPVLNLFICDIKINDLKFEFNLLDPIYYIDKGNTYEIKITKEHNGVRQLSSSVKDLILTMKFKNLEAVEFILKYDTCFNTGREKRFVFDVSGFMSDKKDSIRMCKIYP